MAELAELDELLEDARRAYEAMDWARAHGLFGRARDRAPLAAEDLAALSDAAWWLGRVESCLEAGEAAFHAHVDEGRPDAAAMAAVELAVALFLRGDESRGSGWMGRAQRLLAEMEEVPAHGYLCYVTEVEGALGGGDPRDVRDAARRVAAIGHRHDDPNLVALGVVGEGRALIRSGQVEEGTALLDEAMVAVADEHLDPEWAGNVYCHLMAACHELADIRRARQWTQATSEWLSTVPAAVMFTGICRVHRSQVHQVTGEWDRAATEAARVLDELAGIHVASVAEAHYQLGDLRRLRGAFEEAEQAYRQARHLGRDPRPGLALLRLAQGDTAAAVSSIEAGLHAAGSDRLERARLRVAQVEIALGAGDLDGARRACAALEDAASRYATSGLEASALQWRGAVALQEGRPQEALPALRAACRRWHEVQAPYDAARTCVLLGRAYRLLGDEDAATAELALAAETFERLGAPADGGLVAGSVQGRPLPAGLTEREAEVLALVSSGGTNRQVADELVISEKTVARHLSNIYRKLDVSTRTEAAAFAFEHGIAGSQ